MYALAIHDLRKTYNSGVEALKGVSLNVERGDFFALLGPNGAGKSTIIGILTSLVNKTSGHVSIMGYDIEKDFSKARACIGVVPQEFNFSIFETVFDTVTYQAGYYGVRARLAKSRAEKYLRRLGLWEKRKSITRELSGGMKRRLMIARALVHEPKMLILDEPTAGVDIEIRRSMWQFLADINEQGVTIILTTHYLEEAENLCRNIAIIDQGKIVEYNAMSVLLEKLDRERFILYLKEPYKELPKLNGFDVRAIDTKQLDVEVPKRLGVSALFEELRKHHMVVTSMKNKANRLEELFLKLTEHKSES